MTKCCYGREKNLGHYSSLFPSPTPLSHTTNITFSRIKCERYIFIKKCVRSFIEVRILCLIIFPHIFIGVTSIDKIRENGFELTKERSRGYPAKTNTDADYADDITLLANTPNQAETLLHSLERAVAGIGLHVNAHKMEYMCYNQTGNISTLYGTSPKLGDKFTYLGSSVSSTEKDIDTRLTKAWTAIDRLSTIWKSDLTDKMKRSFFQAAVVSILLYGCTTWTLTKRLKKKLDGNYTRMLLASPGGNTPQGNNYTATCLPPRKLSKLDEPGSKDELISDVLLWTPRIWPSKSRTTSSNIHTAAMWGCSPEDLPEAMNDKEKWWERVRNIRASGTTWWWWWWLALCEMQIALSRNWTASHQVHFLRW